MRPFPRRFAFALAFAVSALAQAPAVHFHHLHLNATDPQADIDFYTKHFNCERAKFAGVMDAVWAQKSWILFNKVNTPPPSDILSTIWHFGWGAPDAPKEFERQKQLGAEFDTPLTDISDIGGGTGKNLFYFMYVRGPDKSLIELNTARSDNFGHIHLLAPDPIATGEWYAKHFGIANVRYQRESRVYRGVHIGPSASFMIDNVNVIIYPLAYAHDAMPALWANRTEQEPTKGRVVDHIGLSVDNLDATLARLKEEGVTITDPPRTAFNGAVKFAFIEGPDKMRIELVEGQAVRPTPPAAATGGSFSAPEDIGWRSVSVYSDGTRMHGEVFTPRSAGDHKLPVIVMAHGWGGTVVNMRRDAVLFARAGYYVLAFDYRGWGASDSRLIPTGDVPKPGANGRMNVEVREVREVVDPMDMATDWFNAIHWVAGEPQADMNRLGLWGSSFSGGLVVYVAEKDHRVKAIHSQVGAMDGRDVMRDPETASQAYADATKMARGTESYAPAGTPYQVVRTVNGQRKMTGTLRGQPVIAKFMVYAPVDEVNEARQCAMQFLVAEKEELFNNADHAVKAYNAFQGTKNLVVMPGITHYGIYTTDFEQANKLALQWFDKNLKSE